MISILTSSTFGFVKPTKYIAYPDLKIGIPSLLLCIEMSLFALLHLFAFPYKPYTEAAKGSAPSMYPISPLSDQPIFNELGPKQGGFLGIKAIVDAMNPWDLVKGFARGMRWLFVGVRNRESDDSYNKNTNDMSLDPPGKLRFGHTRMATKDLPIANEFRRSNFGMPMKTARDDEGATLLSNAQPNPLESGRAYVPARQRYDAQGNDISAEGTHYDSPYGGDQDPQIGMAVSGGPPQQYQSQVPLAQQYLQQKREQRQQKPTPPSEQWANSSRPTRPGEPPNPSVIHEELWGADGSKENKF